MSAAVFRGLSLAVLWVVLGGHSIDSWLVGLPAVALALYGSFRLAPPRPGSFRWRALPGFLLFVLAEMVRGGFQTARMALFPRAGWQPGFVTIEVGLSGTAARNLLVNAVNLIPGTVSASLDGDALEVHLLDRSLPAVADCRRLEARIGRLFAGGER